MKTQKTVSYTHLDVYKRQEFLDPFVQPEFQNRYGTGSNGVRSGSGIYSWGQKLLPCLLYTSRCV